MAADLTIKRFDTYPPVVSVLYDTSLGSPGVPMDLSASTAIKFIMKGSFVLVVGTASKLTTGTFTATATLGSNVLTSVSSFTNVQKGSSLLASGVIPAGAVVGSYNSSASTITMTDNQGNALAALAGGANVTVTLNTGTVQYTWGASDTTIADTYSQEWEITWSAGQIQTVPNSGTRTIQIVADLENA